MRTILDIIKEMIVQKVNVAHFDQWISSDEIDCKILKELTQGKHKIKKHEIYIDHSPSGGAGMGAYPYTCKVFILKKFKENK